MNLCLKCSIFISEHIMITFIANRPCVSLVDGKNNRGNTNQLQALCNKEWTDFSNTHFLKIIWYKLKITECEHQHGAQKLCKMFVLSLYIYWCDCWCCFLLNTCCLYIDPWRHLTANNVYKTLFKECQSNTNSRSTKIALCWCSCIWYRTSLYVMPG